MSKEVVIERKYRKLTHIEHILTRPERHLGSIRSKTADTWVFNPIKNAVVQVKDFEYCPALVKQFDEIITNSVDHSKTPEGTHLTEITVTITKMNGQITVADNGGIPVVKHAESKEWLPEMLFGSLFAGSNFNDDDPEYNNKTAGGQNGEGASLVNVFSKRFTVTTSDGKKTFNQIFEANMSQRSTPMISNVAGKGTSISWIPDYPRLGLTGLDENNLLMLFRRAFEVAACNPRLKVVLNGVHLRIERFGHFVDYFSPGATIDETPEWMVGLMPSTNNTFTHYSYVNSVATREGGPHVDYVADQVVAGIRADLEKKLKTELRPAQIKNHLALFISATIHNPRFDSQTKERLTTTITQFGTSYKVSSKLVKKAYTIALEGLQKEIAALRNDEDAADIASAAKDIAKRSTRDIEKYHPATSAKREGCTLILTEGDSASNPILAARDTKKVGLFPQKGKSLNVLRASRKDVMKNEEFKNICTIMGGIVPGQPIDLATCRYKEVVIATDADEDGKHIRGLIIMMFCIFWPDFVRAGRLKLLYTPAVRCWIGKEMFEFDNSEDYEAWLTKQTAKEIKKKFLKGLGGNSTVDFRRFLDNLHDYTVTVTMDDKYMESLKLAFDVTLSDQRKEWFSDVSIFEAEVE